MIPLIEGSNEVLRVTSAARRCGIARKTYDRMAPIYEGLTNVYSLGCVPRAKRSQLAHIRPGDRVLYAGLGPGRAAVNAAERGADVTGIDLSLRMIEISRSRFEAAGIQADLHHGDLMTYEPSERFDIVVANFLLDCFDDETRPRVVEQLSTMLVSGGRLLVTDTGRPRGSLPARAFWYGYQGIAYSTTWMQGVTPFLPVMDLSALLGEAGVEVEETILHRPWRRGPAVFESVVGIKS